LARLAGLGVSIADALSLLAASVLSALLLIAAVAATLRVVGPRAAV
jgi:hypothetical protein